MAYVLSQNIPSELMASYILNLQVATAPFSSSVYGLAVYGSNIYGSTSPFYIRKRYPFELPPMQGGVV